MTQPVFIEPGDVRPCGAVVCEPHSVCDGCAGGPQFTPAQQMEAAAAAFLAAELTDEAPERDPEHDYAVPDAGWHPCHEGEDQCPEHRLPVAAPPPPATAPVVPMFAGTYAVYDDGTGGVVLVLGQSTGETLHHRIPAAMIKMAERFGGGGIARMFGGA